MSWCPLYRTMDSTRIESNCFSVNLGTVSLTAKCWLVWVEGLSTDQRVRRDTVAAAWNDQRRLANDLWVQYLHHRPAQPTTRFNC